jgi:hypothetical protein
MAEDVVARWWRAHALALRDDDVAVLTQLTGGAGRRWELGAVSCGCLETKLLRPMLRATYYVPRQAAYPARFVAEVLTTYSPGHKGVEILVFSRSSRTAPWQVIENSTYSRGPGQHAQMNAQDQDQVDHDGLVAPASRGQLVRTRIAAAQLARVWQEAKETGRVPRSASAFAGGQTKSRIEQVAGHRQDQVQVNGLLGHYRYYTKRTDPVVVVPYAAGYDLSCQPVRSTITFRGRPGEVVYQDPAQRNWGTQIPAGSYRSITDHDVWPTCFAISRSGTGPVVVFNQDFSSGTVTARR